MVLKMRDTQTEVKHRILSDYLGAWAGIITSGLARQAAAITARGIPFRCRLMYVDGFAHKGRYAGDTAEVLRKGAPNTPTWGSPILGIQALDRVKEHALKTYGLAVETVAVLSEIEAENFQDLKESLELAGLDGRLVFDLPQSLADGQIVAIHGDFLKHLDAVVRLAQDRYTFSFFLLDPYGPTGIPYQAVSRVISLQRTDVMINFPYLALHRSLGVLAHTEEMPADRATLANYDEMFGTQRWRDVIHRTKGDASLDKVSDKVEVELAKYYLERLQAADPELAVKHIKLQFHDRDRTIFYLYLTTHDPNGALTLNKVLSEAELTQFVLKWDYQQAKWLHDAQNVGQDFQQDLLFGLSDEKPPESHKPREVDISAHAMDIWRTFRGQTRKVRQVYTSLANSDLFPSDVTKALSHLKKHKLADYKDTKMDTSIFFKKEGG